MTGWRSVTTVSVTPLQTHHRLCSSLNCQDLISDGELDTLHFSFIIHSVEEILMVVIIVVTVNSCSADKATNTVKSSSTLPVIHQPCFSSKSFHIFLPRLRYLKATLFLSSGPLTTTPVAPPERTANTCSHRRGWKTNEIKTDSCCYCLCCQTQKQELIYCIHHRL